MLNLTAEEALKYQGKIDLLLVTATETETIAVEERLKPINGLAEVALTHIENHTYRLGRFGAFTAIQVQCVMGNRAAGSATTATIEAGHCWTPRAVVMLGIAWGNPRVANAGLGDVLIASSVQDFENARVGTTYAFRSPETEAGVKLLDRFRSITSWTFELPDGRLSSRRLGLLLSGDKLIASAEFRDILLEGFSRAIGGDMESYGVAQACRAMGVEWIIAKGICDWGDESKGNAWQRTAAKAAVSFSLAALSHPSAMDGLHQRFPIEHQPITYRDSDGSSPSEIPIFTHRHIGREDELAALVGSLTAESREMKLCFIVGMGGVGKTYLAANAARNLIAKGAYPDGIIWHEIYDQSPTQVMAHVIDAFGAGATLRELSALQAEYRRTLRDRRVLVVIDNAVAASQVSALLCDSRGSAILVTTRNHMPSLKSRAAEFIDLKRMTSDDAVELLQAKSGLQGEQDTGLRSVASLCGYLPLALSIAGSLLGEGEMWPSVKSLARRLETRRLDCLAIDGCPDLDVRAVLLVSYERMEARLARVFRALSMLGRSSFGASVVSQMLHADKDETITDLSRLIGRSVLERSSYGRYVIHDLLRDLAAELAVNDESPEILATLRQRADEYWKAWQEYWRLGGMAAAFARRGNADNAIEYYHKALALNEKVGDREAHAASLGGIAAAWAKKGNADEAIKYFEKAQTLNEEIGNRRGQASAYGGIAAAWAKKGNADKAIEYFEKSQALNEEIGNRRGQASAYGGIAAAWAKKGNADKAIEYSEKSLALSAEIGDRHGEASAYGGIAAAWAKKGNADKAIEYFEKSQALNEELCNRHGQASAYGGIAAAWAKKGNADKAIEYFDKAQALNDETGNQHGQAHALGGLAAAYAQSGNTDRAIDYHERAQQISQNIGDWKGQAHALGGIAAAYAAKGNADRAIEYHEKAQTLSEKIGDWKGKAHALGGIAAAHAKKGEIDKAIEYFERAQTLNEKIGDWKGQAHAFGGIAAAYATKGNPDKAIEYHEKAQKLSEKIGDRIGQARALGGIAGILSRAGEKDRAIEYYRRALELDEAIGNSRYIGFTLTALLRLAKSVGNKALVDFCTLRLNKK